MSVVEQVLRRAQSVGAESAVRAHGAGLSPTERDLILGLSQAEVTELLSVKQQLGGVDRVLPDNKIIL